MSLFFRYTQRYSYISSGPALKSRLPIHSLRGRASLVLRGFTSTAINSSPSQRKSRQPSHLSPTVIAAPNGITLPEFRLAVLSNDAPTILSSYEFFGSNGLLRKKDARELTRAVQTISSKGRYSKWNVIGSDVLSIIQLYKSGALPPHPATSSHLLNILKNQSHLGEALELWTWLEKQGNDYVNTGTYGTALELLAVSRQSPDVCESTYERGLDSSSNARNRYLMAQNAVLPDPYGQITTIGTSSGLLEGIATARFAYGNWREAYLALEAAIRLHPFQIPSSFVGLVTRQRPLEEVLHFFGLYCFSGSRLKGYDLHGTLLALAKAIRVELESSAGRHYRIFRYALAQLEILQCCVASNQTIPQKSASNIIAGVLSCLPRQHEAIPSNQQARFSILASKLNSALITLFPKLGCTTDALHASSLSIALRLDYHELAKEVLLNLLPLLGDSPRILHGVMAATVGSRNNELATTLLTSLAQKDSQKCDLVVLETLLDKAVTADQVSFCSELLPSFAASPEDLLVLQAKSEQQAEKMSAESAPKSREGERLGRRNEAEHSERSLHRQERRIKKLIDKLIEMASALESPRVIDLQQNPLERPSLNHLLCTFPEQWHVSLYHDMHIAPLAQIPSSTGSNTQAAELGTISSTNVSVYQARFECFKTFNDLLLLAEAEEMSKQQRSDEVQAVDVTVLRATISDWLPQTEEQWRSRVLSLRAASPTTSDNNANDGSAPIPLKASD